LVDVGLVNITPNDWRTTIKGKQLINLRLQIGGSPTNYQRRRGQNVGGAPTTTL